MLKMGGYDVLHRAEGTTAVEYAFILPILLVLVSGIIEFNIAMYASSVLEGATTRAARTGTTGFVNSTASGACPSPVVNGVVSPQTQSTYINCLVGVYVSGLMNSSYLRITYNDTNSSSFSSTTDAPTSTGACTNNPALVLPSFPLCSESSTQNSGDIVVYTVSYPWPIFSPILTPFIGSSMTLTSSVVVKNEPYGSTGR